MLSPSYNWKRDNDHMQSRVHNFTIAQDYLEY